MQSTWGSRVRIVALVGGLCLANFGLGVGSTGIAHATLIDRGNGLIYDNVLNLTWLQDADLAKTNMFGLASVGITGAMDWDTAQSWIAAMNAAHYKGYDDWRLPRVTPITGTTLNLNFAYDGSTQYGYNITNTHSELAHLFNVDLESKALYSPSGVSQPDFGVKTTGPFLNVQTDDYYWYGTEVFSNDALYFISSNGLQNAILKNATGMQAWAVRDGDVVNNASPVCSAAQAFPAVLWKPDHQFVPIVVMGVTDPDGDAVTITVTGVTQDEPVNGKGDGNTSPDAVIQAGSASVRAERSGKGNGRVYQISFKAEDGKGGSCTGAVTVGVPHSLKKGLAAIDDGQLYDSTISDQGQRPPRHDDERHDDGSHGNDDGQVHDSTVP